MKSFLKTMLAGVVVTFGLSAAQAGDVSVKGVHLCCGQCVKIVGTALGKVDGISNPACDRKTKTVSFTATNDKAAKAAVKALAKAGFHGAAKHGDKKLAFPASGAKKGQKADAVTLTSVHLCCGGCVNAAKKALTGIKAEFAADRKAKTVTLTGSGIDINAAVAALNEAGFNGQLKK